jgi:hypothetical protein
LKELGTDEAAVIIAAGCAAFGADCSQDAKRIADVGKKISKATSKVPDSCGGKTTMGKVSCSPGIKLTERKGEQYYGIMPAPARYQICNAKLDLTSMTGAANFNTTIVRNKTGNGLGFYAVVPVRAAGEWVDANVHLMFVKNPKIPKHKCLPTDAHPWICGENPKFGTGEKQCKFYPNTVEVKAPVSPPKVDKSKVK